MTYLEITPYSTKRLALRRSTTESSISDLPYPFSSWQLDDCLGTNCVWLDWGTLFVCGGKHEGKIMDHAQLIDFDVNESLQLPDMSHARLNAGIYRYLDRIYVFGGHNEDGPLKECEVFSLSKQEWSPLPDLPDPVDQAVVVFQEGVLYIHGNNSDVFSFDLTTHEYDRPDIEFSPYPDKKHLIDEGHIFGFEGATQYFPDPAGNMLVNSPAIVVQTTLPSN